MADVVFPVVLILTCLRGVLVVDAVSSSSALARLTRAVNSMAPNEAAARGPITSPTTSPRQQALAVSAASLPVRILHRRLVAMHFVACIQAIAGTAQYILPPSDIVCSVAHRAATASLLLYDASLVLFLLAKTSVTNGNRPLARWEKCITWWSRAYAYIYLPACAVMLAVVLDAEVDEEWHCRTTREAKDPPEVSSTLGYMTNNIMLTVQFVLLLAMFIKPMLLSQGSTQSGGAVYRRVVNRNILCTVCIVFAYIITTLVVVLAMLDTSDTATEIMKTAPAVTVLLTLCLTEIALPLGFSSCYKSIVTNRHLASDEHTARYRNYTLASAKTHGKGIIAATGITTTHQATATAIVPVE